PDIELTAEIAPETPTPFIDADQFRQVLVNLVQNAVEAVDPATGWVRVEGHHAGDGIVLKVIDNGSGIPDDIRKNIFEPLYTTKLRGTGLGLAICASILARHGGTIDVESEPGTGATFILQFPLGAPSYAEAPRVGGAADLRFNGRTEDNSHR
ncbi:MAG TPA: ATP-binding protein, partial [Thermoanaerobaculia bacterium]|nr:ATP-binding protein [Thermoanaerobaculia bacterium]